MSHWNCRRYVTKGNHTWQACQRTEGRHPVGAGEFVWNVAQMRLMTPVRPGAQAQARVQVLRFELGPLEPRCGFVLRQPAGHAVLGPESRLTGRHEASLLQRGCLVPRLLCSLACPLSRAVQVLLPSRWSRPPSRRRRAVCWIASRSRGIWCWRSAMHPSHSLSAWGEL